MTFYSSVCFDLLMSQSRQLAAWLGAVVDLAVQCAGTGHTLRVAALTCLTRTMRVLGARFVASAFVLVVIKSQIRSKSGWAVYVERGGRGQSSESSGRGDGRATSYLSAPRALSRSAQVSSGTHYCARPRLTGYSSKPQPVGDVKSPY